ncbi:MAG: hypothetical protein K2Q01_02945 [Rickettsiales bacterium]|nr:hypothetical protein [Rickettsiales bacterium]
MAIDYSIYDFKKSFTVHEAALAWAETEYEPENAQKAYDAIYTELLRDVRGGTVQSRVKRDIRKNWINWESDSSDRTNWSKAEIWTEDLKRWAEARGQKPKFLFPEMRSKPEAEATALPTKNNTTAQAKAKRENELHTLLEKVYLALRSELRRSPDADEMLATLRNRRKEFDTDEIIREIKDKRVAWVHTDGTEGISMGRKSLQNYLSKLNKKYEKQSVIKKIPA